MGINGVGDVAFGGGLAWLGLIVGSSRRLNLFESDGLDGFNALITDQLDIHATLLGFGQQNESKRRLLLIDRLGIFYDVTAFHDFLG
jgi:hypothetical protein